MTYSSAPDPVTQAVMAMCAHAHHRPECEPCDARRSAAHQHLLSLVSTANNALGGVA